ncbi:unnamed protein product [Arabidopsis arenosa]|uniref:Band 7 domain-containing protein n=1 Tax=Arabidopsis arenosa TaxID=38785 RepID=A0A8S1ZES4_ARAAE|nr:unnamed protein product [Arabidopsis arenosa]
MGNICGCFEIGEYTRGIEEKRGKFSRELKPGHHCVPWCFGYRIVGRVSMRVQCYNVSCISRTKDDVFVNVVASIHFQILDVADVNNAKKAFYVHSDPEQLIKAHAFNALKTNISINTFLELFQKKDDIADTVSQKLNQLISADFGYGHFKTIILDIAPEDHAKRIINIGNAAPKIASALPEATTEELIEVLLAKESKE